MAFVKFKESTKKMLYIRKGGQIGFSAGFMKDLPNAKFVTIFVDEEKHRLGFRFTSEKQEDSYVMSSHKGYRFISSPALVKQLGDLKYRKIEIKSILVGTVPSTGINNLPQYCADYERADEKV